MGAAVSFVDTGAGITPANFRSVCCTGSFEAQPELLSIPKCNAWKSANESLFGKCSTWGGLWSGPCAPCSDEAAVAMGYGALQVPVPVPVPRIDTDPTSPTYGDAYNPCTGLLVQADDADLAVCLAQKQREAQIASNTAAAGDILSTQCRTMKAECDARPFGSYLAPNAACSDCSISFVKPATILTLLAVAVGTIALVKLA
jgi:hypothetical protein